MHGTHFAALSSRLSNTSSLDDRRNVVAILVLKGQNLVVQVAAVTSLTILMTLLLHLMMLQRKLIIAQIRMVRTLLALALAALARLLRLVVAVLFLLLTSPTNKGVATSRKILEISTRMTRIRSKLLMTQFLYGALGPRHQLVVTLVLVIPMAKNSQMKRMTKPMS